MNCIRSVVTTAPIATTILLVSIATLTSSSANFDDLDSDMQGSKKNVRENIVVSAEKRLIKHLIKRYEETGVVGRPVHNTSITLNVGFGIGLIQILDLNEKSQMLTTNVWCRYEWKDIFMRWDPDLFDGVIDIRVPSSLIWTPDIVLYNYADTRLKEHRESMVVVSSDGSILWIPQAIFKSTCPIDITNFPFDIQTCMMKFGSWTYDGFKLNITFYQNNDQVDINDYVFSNEWALIGHPAKKNIKYYACCVEPYPDLTFEVVLKRVAAFYHYILVLPCVLLSFLTLVIFWLPPESPAKILLGMNIFVAFFVLLLLLADITPPAVSRIPLIGAYFCMNMILITMSTFLAVIVITTHIRGDRKNKVPEWLRRVVLFGLAKVLCMHEFLDADATKAVPTGDPPDDPQSKRQKKRNKHKKSGDGTSAAEPASGSNVTSAPAGETLERNLFSFRHNPPVLDFRKHATTLEPSGEYTHYQRETFTAASSTSQQQQTFSYWRQPGLETTTTICQTRQQVPPSPSEQCGQGRQPLLASGEQEIRYMQASVGGVGVHSELDPNSAVSAMQLARAKSLQNDAREIRRIIKSYINRMQDKDASGKVQKEWRIVARVLDRLFFLFYVSTIIISLATIFPRETGS